MSKVFILLQSTYQIITVISIIISLGFLIKLRLVRKRSSFKTKLELLIFAVIFLQSFELLCRVATEEAIINQFHDFFYFFILFVGYLCYDLVYALLYKNSAIYNTLKVSLIVGTVLIAFLCVKYDVKDYYIYTDSYGFVTDFEGNPMAKISRLWIGVGFLLAVYMFYQEFLKKPHLKQDFRNFFIGLVITGSLGFLGQIVLPLLVGFEIPMISISVPIFIYFSYSLLSNNILVKLNLRESSSTIFNSINAYISFIDKDYSILYFNKNFASLFGGVTVGDSLNQKEEFGALISELEENKGPQFNVVHLAVDEVHLGIRISPIYEKRKLKGYFLFGINVSHMVDQFNKSKVSLQQLLEFSKNQKSYILEYYPSKKLFQISSRLSVYLNLGMDTLAPQSLLFYLRKHLACSDLQKLITFLRTPDFSKDFKITFKDENSGQYDFRITSYENEFSKHLVFFLLEENQCEEMKNWYQQDVSWIISHIFRKNVANALGLLDYLKENDELNSNPVYTDKELIKLINKEIEELDNNLIAYSRLK